MKRKLKLSSALCCCARRVRVLLSLKKSRVLHTLFTLLVLSFTYCSGAGSAASRSTKSCVGCLRRDDETRSKHLPRLYTYVYMYYYCTVLLYSYTVQ